MKPGQIVAAWIGMLVLGGLLWVMGGSRLVADLPAGPRPAVSPSPVASSPASPSPSLTPEPLDPGLLPADAIVGRWVELSGTDVVLTIVAQDAGVRIEGPPEEVGSFEPAGEGFQEIRDDEVRRLELDADDNLVLLSTRLGGGDQVRTSRLFTPVPEGDEAQDPNAPGP